MGATALFGEKYGDFVRVIEFDRNYSIELCGGTHIKNTAEIAFFKILSEGSVSAGVRRVEALSNEGALQFLQNKWLELQAIQERLQNPKDIVQAVDKLMEQQQILKKRVEQLENQQVSQMLNDLKARFTESEGIHYMFEVLDLPHAEAAKQLSFDLKDIQSPCVIVLGYLAQEKPGISIYISEELVASKSWNASNMVRECGKFIQGGGGGQAFFATAGGKEPKGLVESIEHAKRSFGFIG